MTTIKCNNNLQIFKPSQTTVFNAVKSKYAWSTKHQASL